MKNKKGFTLVELLAVIAILAILVLIAIPNVMSMFNNAKKSAFETEVKEIVSLSNQMAMTDLLNNSQDLSYIKIKNQKCGKQLDLNVRNEFEYYVEMTGTGKITLLYATDGTFQYKYEGPELKKDNVGEAQTIADLEESNIFTLSCDYLVNNKTIKRAIKNIAAGDNNEIIDKGSSNDNSCNYMFAYDKTKENALRYVGNNPCNYIKYNNQEWRIIGIVDNKVKIVKTVSLGSMDWTDAGRAGYRYNNHDWTTSKIKNYLNTTFYNSISSSAKSMILESTWYLGAIGNNQDGEWLLRKMYNAEKSNEKYGNNPTRWTGKIGLMSPSDYGFATSGGNVGRENCYNVSILNWQNADFKQCATNDWIYDNSNVWLISPAKNYSYHVFLIGKYGQVGVNGEEYPTGHQVRPSLFLQDSVIITSGDGSKNNPYILQ